jgi:cytochrome P450 family 142 subfamily A polypeptide 1
MPSSEVPVEKPVEFLASSSWDARMPERLRWLRRNDPVHWSEKDGLWVVTRFADVVAVSKDQETFTSARGVRPLNPVKLPLIDESGRRHTEVRRLINRGFTPRMVKKLEEKFRKITREAIDAVSARGECDFVESIAAPLPLLLIAEMIGIRSDDRAAFHRWSDAMIAAEGNLADPEVALAATQAFGEYAAYVTKIIEARRRNPKEDLVSALTGAKDAGILGANEIRDTLESGDAPELANDELIMLLVLLLVAGNETTRNAISGGVELLIRNPGEREKLLARPELLPSAVEEIVRMVSPVLSFARTATRDVELGDADVAAGDKVLMIYPSANRDELEFDEPDAFRVERNPHHVGFGIGPHFCLGANLARMELRVALGEVLKRMPDLRFADAEGAVIRPSALVRSCVRMKVAFTPGR